MGLTEKLGNGIFVRETGLIIGEQLILRPMTDADTDLIIEWRNRDHVRRNFIYQHPFTKEGHDHWRRTMIETGKAVQFIICEKSAVNEVNEINKIKKSGENSNQTDFGNQIGQPVGSCYLREIDYEFLKAEYGMFIGEEAARSRGYGTEAMVYTIEYAFQVLKLHKIFSRVFAENKASIHSCEKVGMTTEAYLKDEVRLNDRFYDMVLVAKINED